MASIISSPAVASFDFFDPVFIADPHVVLDRLRDEAPVVFHPDTGMWLVTRYDDIRNVLLDPDTFAPDNALSAARRLSFSALRVLAKAGFDLPPTLANNSTSSHPDIRRLVTRFIGPQAASAARPLIKRVAKELIDDAAHQMREIGVCDLAATVACELPCRVIVELVGLKNADIAGFKRWSGASLELFWGHPDADRQVELAKSVGEFYAWLTHQIEKSDPEPGSLVDALNNLCAENGCTKTEVIAALFFTLIAGQETTSQLISSLFLNVLRDASQWEHLVADPSAIEAWVDEVLRREPPITTWRRVTLHTVSLGGVELPAGTQLLLLLAAAGSDPQVFEDADQICPHRPNSRQHLGFGLGRHRCPGAELARAEGEIVLRSAIERLPHLRLAETGPPMIELLSFRAPRRVLVTYAECNSANALTSN